MASYRDALTGEKLLDVKSLADRKVIVEGMLFGFQSQKMGRFEGMLKYGWITEEEYKEKLERYKVDRMQIDLEANYGLMDLDKFSADDLEEYLSGYIERLRPWLKTEEFKFIEENMDKLKDYLIPKIPGLQAYTGLDSYNGDTLRDAKGSIVFADNSEPPVFLYLEFGLRELPHPRKQSEEEKEEMIQSALEFIKCLERETTRCCSSPENEDANKSSSKEDSAEEEEVDAKKRGFCHDPDTEKKRRKLTAALA